jgi:hypothetical protein
MDKELQQLIEDNLVAAGSSAFKLKNHIQGTAEIDEDTLKYSLERFLRPKIYKLMNNMSENEKTKYLAYLTLHADSDLQETLERVAELFMDMCKSEDLG